MNENHEAQGERELFERTMKEVFGEDEQFGRDDHGRYNNRAWQDAYIGWIHRAGIALRATEGQAQTSAAAHADGIEAAELQTLLMTEFACYRPTYPAGIMAWARIALLDNSPHRAAQLVDSTAHGAPVDEPSVKLMMELGLPNWSKSFINGFKLNQDGMNYLYRHPAAPTAQQSLTGGAVPGDWTVEYDKYTSPGTIRLSSPKWGGCFLGKPTYSDTVLSTIMYRYFADHLAAAPLPQVQSEALERKLSGPDLVDAVAAWIADQQPVTPSGALADNDGGVISLRYRLREAEDVGEKRHAQAAMAALGIAYEKSIPQSLGEQWWFFNCTNLPDPLPPYLSHMKIEQRWISDNNGGVA